MWAPEDSAILVGCIQYHVMSFDLDADELRAIITGERGFRKCPDCQGLGEESTLGYVLADDPDQNNEQFKSVSQQFATDFDSNNLPSEYSYGEIYVDPCSTCRGVGYIPIDGYDL